MHARAWPDMLSSQQRPCKGGRILIDWTFPGVMLNSPTPPPTPAVFSIFHVRLDLLPEHPVGDVRVVQAPAGVRHPCMSWWGLLRWRGVGTFLRHLLDIFFYIDTF